MFRLAKVLLTIAAIVPAMSSIAQPPTPTTTAFDGAYIGVSRKSEGTFGGDATRQVQGDVSFRSDSHWCPGGGVPLPLTIVNGIAQSGKLEGAVSPQGVLVMREFWSHFDGRIDTRGTVDRGLQLPAGLAKTAPADDAVGRRLHRGIERNIKDGKRPGKVSAKRRPGYFDD
jgi:hypothetical protein